MARVHEDQERTPRWGVGIAVEHGEGCVEWGARWPSNPPVLDKTVSVVDTAPTLSAEASLLDAPASWHVTTPDSSAESVGCGSESPRSTYAREKIQQPNAHGSSYVEAQRSM